MTDLAGCSPGGHGEWLEIKEAEMAIVLRRPGTTRTGTGFEDWVIEAVWNKGNAIVGYDARVWRRDACGWPMLRTAYGQTGEHGWEVDHIRPVAKGGSDDLANLQPLHWRVNRAKSDDWPKWYCPVAA